MIVRKRTSADLMVFTRQCTQYGEANSPKVCLCGLSILSLFPLYEPVIPDMSLAAFVSPHSIPAFIQEIWCWAVGKLKAKFAMPIVCALASSTKCDKLKDPRYRIATRIT